MGENTLAEYRCRCGRLLFKGMLYLSIIELKCKKCGTITLFYEFDHMLDPAAGGYVFLVDETGLIVGASKTIQSLGYSQAEAGGMNIGQIDGSLSEIRIKKILTDHLVLGQSERQAYVVSYKAKHLKSDGIVIIATVVIRVVWFQQKTLLTIICVPDADAA